MSDIGERLAKGAAVLQELELRRSETATPRWGYDREYEIVNQELRDLEAEILRDPGGLEGQLPMVQVNAPMAHHRVRSRGDPYSNIGALVS
jgi:hypothetical protein